MPLKIQKHYELSQGSGSMSKRISIFGYGVTTKPLAKHIKNAVFYDDRCKEPYGGVDGSFVRPASEFDPDFSDLEITSPGIPPSNPLIQRAKHLISEYDYFKDVMNLKIWISGTNGKTTTTQMLQHLLEDKGSLAGGNIGTALAELNQKSPIWILETSSFTMHYTNQAKPNIYLLLPLSPDHISWHGSQEAYIADKLKPLGMMRSTDKAIIPAIFKDVATKAELITYKDEADLAEIFGINRERVAFNGAFLMDALLAMAVDKLLFGRVDYAKMNSFVLDPHRQEELKDSKSRLWVNDTKATNIDATLAALKRYENSYIHLILGGDDKGVDLHELFEYLKEKRLTIYAIGSNRERLIKLSREYGVEYVSCKNLVTAITEISIVLQKEEIALLSPAASSLDEFSSYAERGDIFKKFVRKI